MLAQYRNAVAQAKPGDARDLALARQFVLPGRSVTVCWCQGSSTAWLGAGPAQVVQPETAHVQDGALSLLSPSKTDI